MREQAPADEGGFEGFYRAEGTRLVRALFLLTGDVAEAEELAQEAFLRAWERWDRVSVMHSPPGTCTGRP